MSVGGALRGRVYSRAERFPGRSLPPSLSVSPRWERRLPGCCASCRPCRSSCGCCTETCDVSGRYAQHQSTRVTAGHVPKAWSRPTHKCVPDTRECVLTQNTSAEIVQRTRISATRKKRGKKSVLFFGNVSRRPRAAPCSGDKKQGRLNESQQAGAIEQKSRLWVQKQQQTTREASTLERAAQTAQTYCFKRFKTPAQRRLQHRQLEAALAIGVGRTCPSKCRELHDMRALRCYSYCCARFLDASQK